MSKRITYFLVAGILSVPAFTGRGKMKNNVPECVLLSPEEYTKMADEINDAKLLNLANKRMEKFDVSQSIPAEDVYKKLGITEEDLADYKDIELE